jgi:peptidoglycan-associated lipoprotein
VIEGHCDERGTESYNMVLGERRANAVKEFLVDLGVPGDKLEVMSYGKEKPFCSDQNEQCWQENRRGHFVLR